MTTKTVHARYIWGQYVNLSEDREDYPVSLKIEVPAALVERFLSAKKEFEEAEFELRMIYEEQGLKFTLTLGGQE